MQPAPVQHRGELRHQHQLAELRRRVNDEPPHPDGGSTVQQFVSAAGHGGDAALIRGSPAGQRPSATSGSTSCARPSASSAAGLVFAIVLIAGSSRTRTASPTHTAPAPRKIPGGPNASMESIKQLGTNGGDFFNVNSPPLLEPDRHQQLPRALRHPDHPFALASRSAMTRTSARLRGGRSWPSSGWPSPSRSPPRSTESQAR